MAAASASSTGDAVQGGPDVIDAQLEHLFRQMRRSDAAVDSEFERLLRFGGHSTHWHMRLHLLQAMWHTWHRRSEKAHMTATMAIAEALSVGAADWQALGLGWRAVAHLELGNIAEGVDDLMDAEGLLADLAKGVLLQQMSPVAAGALETMAIAYGELDWFDLAIDRQDTSNAIPGNPFTSGAAKTRGKLSLSLLHWRLAITLERMGVADPRDRALYDSHLQRAAAILAEVRGEPMPNYPGYQIEFLSDLVNASLNPTLGLQNLPHWITSPLNIINDQAVVLCRIAHAARAAGDRELARDYAAQALRMMEQGPLMPAAAEEVRFQHYLANLPSDPAVQDQSTDYVLGVNRRAWAQAQRALRLFNEKLATRCGTEPPSLSHSPPAPQ